MLPPGSCRESNHRSSNKRGSEPLSAFLCRPKNMTVPQIPVLPRASLGARTNRRFDDCRASMRETTPCSRLFFRLGILVAHLLIPRSHTDMARSCHWGAHHNLRIVQTVGAPLQGPSASPTLGHSQSRMSCFRPRGQTHCPRQDGVPRLSSPTIMRGTLLSVHSHRAARGRIDMVWNQIGRQRRGPYRTKKCCRERPLT